jgi:solute:Na+ symporter, SSS family
LSFIDYLFLALYLVAIVGVGFYHFRKNQDVEDYFVGGRSLPAGHVGLSIAATDVGGGFSIGLGGLGFSMGLSGSWLLLTGLIGAWVSAVVLVPRVKAIEKEQRLLTYPDLLRSRYGASVALVGAVISALGYAAFTGAQLLAGAKLAAATVFPSAPWGLEPIDFALIVMAAVTILYTVVGGLKAVVYTDSVQWCVLLVGLVIVGIPATVIGLGGPTELLRRMPAGHLSLLRISPITLINWGISIIPIWFVAMTLYQRMYACGSVREAKRAWFIAGIFEYPIMAFSGAFLGACARVAFPEAEAEMGLPLLLQAYLPAGIAGLVVAAYFSAIMSTADSCLMAASGNIVGDILMRGSLRHVSDKTVLRASQIVTLFVGVIAIVVASRFERVLDAALHAYSFMVAGLLVPTLGLFYWRRSSRVGALASMLLGGFVTLCLQSGWFLLPSAIARVGLDPSFYGLGLASLVFVVLSLLFPDPERELSLDDGEHMPDAE